MKLKMVYTGVKVKLFKSNTYLISINYVLPISLNVNNFSINCYIIYIM